MSRSLINCEERRQREGNNNEREKLLNEKKNEFKNIYIYIQTGDFGMKLRQKISS